MVIGSIIPHRNHNSHALHSLLHNLIRPDAAADIRHGKRDSMDNILRSGQSVSILRAVDTRFFRHNPNQDIFQKQKTSKHTKWKIIYATVAYTHFSTAHC